MHNFRVFSIQRTVTPIPLLYTTVMYVLAVDVVATPTDIS